jgi:hypothetical protein
MPKINQLAKKCQKWQFFVRNGRQGKKSQFAATGVLVGRGS